MKHLESSLKLLGLDDREIEDAKQAFLSIKNQFVSTKTNAWVIFKKITNKQ